MISITKYLKRDRRDENEATLRRVVALLLQLIEIHAIQGDESDYAQFRSGIHDIASHFSDDTSPDDLLIIVGQIATALKDYGDRTTRYIKAQGVEYQRMLTMLTETIASTSHASDRTVGRLRDIEKRLERASVIDDVRVLRMQLDQCLESIREEIQAQQAISSRMSPSDSQDTIVAAADLASSENTDVGTGLPGRSAAEAVLADAAVRGGPYYVVMIVANRMTSINDRYGAAVGDRVLRKISEQLASFLPAEDRVFRWDVPCLIVLLRRTAPEFEVRKEVSRIAGMQTEDVVEIGSRSILLPISVSWDLIAVNAPARVIREKIDQFVTAHRDH